MKDIFATLNYAKEKISENSYFKEAGYESIQRMVLDCKTYLTDRFDSIENVDVAKYHLDQIDELFEILNGEIDQIPYGLRERVEKHLFTSLFAHVDELKSVYDEVIQDDE